MTLVELGQCPVSSIFLPISISFQPCAQQISFDFAQIARDFGKCTPLLPMTVKNGRADYTKAWPEPAAAIANPDRPEMAKSELWP